MEVRSRNRREELERIFGSGPTPRRNRMPVRAPVTEPDETGFDRRRTATALGAKCFLRKDHALVRVGSTFGSAPFAFGRGLLPQPRFRHFETRGATRRRLAWHGRALAGQRPSEPLRNHG